MPSSHRTLHSGNIWSDLFTILLYYRLLGWVSLFRTLHSHNYTPGHPSEVKINRKVYICKDVSVYQCVMAAWCVRVSVFHGSMMSQCISVSWQHDVSVYQSVMLPLPTSRQRRKPLSGKMISVSSHSLWWILCQSYRQKYLSFNDFQFPQSRLNYKLKVWIVDWHKSLASSVHQAGFT